MSTARSQQVAFDFCGTTLRGVVIDREPAGDVSSGPNGYLTVEVDGEQYRVLESDVKQLQSRR